jgi:hypothetical protein
VAASRPERQCSRQASSPRLARRSRVARSLGRAAAEAVVLPPLTRTGLGPCSTRSRCPYLSHPGFPDKSVVYVEYGVTADPRAMATQTYLRSLGRPRLHHRGQCQRVPGRLKSLRPIQEPACHYCLLP